MTSSSTFTITDPETNETVVIDPAEDASRKIFLTPELALAILDNNTHNRSIQPRAVDPLKRDILTDNWAYTGEALKLAYDGTVLDGQHRLLAVCAAGKGIWVLLVTGLDIASQKSMDGGRKRTDGDRFRLENETDSALLSSVTGQIWRWNLGDRRWNSNPTPTFAEKNALLAQYPGIRRSVEIARRTNLENRSFSPTPIGVAHHLLTLIDGELAPWFFARIADGDSLKVRHPIHTLRKRMVNDRETKAVVNSARTLAYIIRAWNATRDRNNELGYREMESIVHGIDVAIPEPR